MYTNYIEICLEYSLLLFTVRTCYVLLDVKRIQAGVTIEPRTEKNNNKWKREAKRRGTCMRNEREGKEKQWMVWAPLILLVIKNNYFNCIKLEVVSLKLFQSLCRRPTKENGHRIKRALTQNTINAIRVNCSGRKRERKRKRDKRSNENLRVTRTLNTHARTSHVWRIEKLLWVCVSSTN